GGWCGSWGRSRRRRSARAGGGRSRPGRPMAREPRIPPALTAHLKLLSLEDAARVLGVDDDEVRRLVDRGEIGCYRRGVSGRVGIPLASLEVWQRRIAESAVPIGGVAKRRGRPPKSLRAVG